MNIQVGSDLQHALLSSALIISSGLSELDDLLDGGLYSGELTCLQSFNDNLYSKLVLKIMAFATLVEQKEVIYIATCQSLDTTALLNVMKQYSNFNSCQSTNTDFLKNSQEKTERIDSKCKNINNTNKSKWVDNLKDNTHNISNNIQIDNKSCIQEVNNLSCLSQNQYFNGSQSSLLSQRLKQNLSSKANAAIMDITNINLPETSYNHLKDQKISLDKCMDALDFQGLEKLTDRNIITNSLDVKRNVVFSSPSTPNISNNFSTNIMNALNRIKILHVYNIHELIHTLTFLNYELAQNCRVKLVVMGQLDLLFLHLIGALKIKELTFILSKILQLLKRIAYEHNLAILLISFSDKTLKKHFHTDIFKLQVQNYVNIQCTDNNILFPSKYNSNLFIHLILEKSLRLPEIIKNINLASFI